jgi:ubiquitin carboxyl-terminal hydrolase 8
MGSINDVFAGFQQHDSHDFLVNLMNNFHEALSRNVQYRISGEIITELDRHITHAHEDWSRHYREKHSAILDIFSGQFQTQMMCDVCRHIKYRYDPFMVLDIPIPDVEDQKTQISLDHCFEAYVKPEQLSDSDRLECDKCRIKTRTHKVSTIWTLPHVLIVKLNRFKYHFDKGRFVSRKINTFVTYKVDDFNLSQYVSSPLNDSTKYELYSIVCHTGDAGSGHYYSLCQNPVSLKWTCYNDSRISQIDNPQSIITNHAYILFYRLN